MGKRRETVKKIAKKDKAEILNGYQRVQERIKKVRQQFSDVVSKGMSSGSPNVVLNNYDMLMSIYGGCAATEPLTYGVGSTTGNSIVDNNDNVEDNSVESDIEDNEGDKENMETVITNNPRKRKAACPTLIANKRNTHAKIIFGRPKGQNSYVGV